MKTFGIVLAAFVLLFVGCSNRAEQLEKEKAQLQDSLKYRDQFIQEVMAAINEVHSKLESARAREMEILQQTTSSEAGNGVAHAADRQTIMRQIADIDASLSENRAKLADLELKLKESKTQYASLNKMVADLKQTLEERVQVIAQLNERVRNLETEVSEKIKLVAEKDAVIEQKESTIRDQITMLNTAYYVVGKKDDLENKGIIKDEGGFLWGLIGSTTVLSNGFDNAFFKPIDKSREMTIEVNGKVDKIVPERNVDYYEKEEKGDNLTVLRIVRPEYFWQENHLVVVTK